MNFVELVRALSDEAGLQLSQEPMSPVEFSVDGVDVAISHEVRGEEHAIVLYSELGQVPEARELEVYRILLEANVMWSGTGDGTLGVNSATRQALICYRLTTKDLDGPGFVSVVSAFLELAGAWREFMVAAAEEATSLQAARPQGMILA
jgi:hypothetical protein